MALGQDDVNIVITGNASQAMQEIRKVESSINGLLSLEAGSKLEAGFGAIFNTIAGTLTKVANAVAGIMRNSLAIGGGFEAQMTSVKIISGATADELEKLTAKAREMGADLPIAAKDAAQAMELLAQRGTKAKDILTTVADVSALAISQNVDMASAADLLGSTMTNFGIAVQDAAKVTDIFNNACNQSALSMSKIIEAMKYVGPAASAVKMQLTEAVSALEVATNAGLTGEMAGTGFATILNKLSSESHIMGVETKNLDGSLRNISKIFSELYKKGFSLADATALFGMRGNKVALSLANYAHTLEENEKNLQNWGATQNAVTEKMKTWTNVWNAFQSATEEFHIEIFEQIKNQAKDSVNVIAELTREFSKWVGQTQIAGDTLNAFLDGLGFKVPSVENLQSLLKNFNIQKFLDSVQSFGKTIKNIADGIINMFSMIKAPLGFLIEHLGLFASISFWGWILGKGLQVPAAIMGIAGSFTQFKNAVATLGTIGWASLTQSITNFFTIFASPANFYAAISSTKWSALINPITAISAAFSALGYQYGATLAKIHKAKEDFDKTIKDIQKEIQDANEELKLHIDFNIDTGFEAIPDSYVKAADDVRLSFDEANNAAKESFKKTFSEALDFVIKKFPEIVDEAKKAGIDINNVSKQTFTQIASALQGNENAYKGLPDIFKKVTARINQMNMALGKGNLALYYSAIQYENLQREVDKMKPQNKVNTFFEEMGANLRNALDNIPAHIDEANKYLKGSNGQLAIQVSLKQAEDVLNKFVKEAADKYAIPEDIVKQSLIDRLNVLAVQGNKTALALYKVFADVDKPFHDFLDSAKEAIEYLGESPQKFVPALNSMMNGIQKIDPVTGNITEKFKKAHDALQQWADVSFDKLNNRIQKLRKAVEGGFIDTSVLENELKNVMPKLKLKVISDFEPIRGQFQSQYAYEATIASEFVNQVIDLFGDAGEEFMKKMYAGMSGADIGRAILRDNQRDLSAGNGITAYINGIEQKMNSAANSLNNSVEALNYQLNKTKQPSLIYGSIGGNLNEAIRSVNERFGIDLREVANIFSERAKGAADSFNSNLAPVNSSIQLLNTSIRNNSDVINRAGDSMLALINSIQTPNSTASVTASVIDYSNLFANIIKEIVSLHATARENIGAVNSVADAVKNIHLQPVDTYQGSNDNVSNDLSNLASVIESLRKATEYNSNLINSLQSSIGTPSGNENFSAAISPLSSAVQSLNSALNVIVNLHQANSNALNDVFNAIVNIEGVLKSINTGNTYDIDIIQQGFNVAKKSDADYLANSAALAVRVGFGNGGL